MFIYFTLHRHLIGILLHPNTSISFHVLAKDSIRHVRHSEFILHILYNNIMLCVSVCYISLLEMGALSLLIWSISMCNMFGKCRKCAIIFQINAGNNYNSQDDGCWKTI